MWVQERDSLSYKEGFYIFGGMDQRDQPYNDLWLLQPDYDYNKKVIALDDYSFVCKQMELGMTLKLLD